MSTDRKLAWAGLVLALPGVITLFRDEHLKTAILISLLLLICASALFYVSWSNKRPGITVAKLTKTLTIADDKGHQATILHCQEFVPNYPTIDTIWFRNIVSDGSIASPKIDGMPPDAQERLSCLLSVAKRYSKPLARGEKQEVKLTYDVVDSFPATEEALLHDVGVAVKLLILEVHLPASRKSKSARLHLLAAGTPLEEISRYVEVSKDNLHLVARVPNPKSGYTYELSWVW